MFDYDDGVRVEESTNGFGSYDADVKTRRRNDDAEKRKRVPTVRPIVPQPVAVEKNVGMKEDGNYAVKFKSTEGRNNCGYPKVDSYYAKDLKV